MGKCILGRELREVIEVNARMKESFQVDQQWMLTRRNHILMVEVCSIQGVEQGQIGPLPFIKMCHLLLRLTGGCSNELGPAIGFAINEFQCTQGRFLTMSIEPGEQLLKMDIYCQ